MIHIIPGDAKQPRLEFRVILQRTQLLIHSYKGFLGQVFSFFYGGHHAINEVQDLAREKVIDSLKGPKISLFGLFYPLNQENRVCGISTGVQVFLRQTELTLDDSDRY